MYIKNSLLALTFVITGFGLNASDQNLNHRFWKEVCNNWIQRETERQKYDAGFVDPKVESLINRMCSPIFSGPALALGATKVENCLRKSPAPFKDVFRRNLCRIWGLQLFVSFIHKEFFCWYGTNYVGQIALWWSIHCNKKRSI